MTCTKSVQKHFWTEHLCALQVFLCALISWPVCAQFRVNIGCDFPEHLNKSEPDMIPLTTVFICVQDIIDWLPLHASMRVPTIWDFSNFLRIILHLCEVTVIVKNLVLGTMVLVNMVQIPAWTENGLWFLLHLYPPIGLMSRPTLTAHCRWEDKKAREKIGQPPSKCQIFEKWCCC